MRKKATRTKREEICNYIRGLIADGQLKPGDKVPTILALGEQFNCSHTTARMAFNRLKADGILVGFRGNTSKGTYIAGEKKHEQKTKAITTEKKAVSNNIVKNHLEYKIRCEVNNIKVTVVPEGINNFQIIVQNA